MNEPVIRDDSEDFVVDPKTEKRMLQTANVITPSSRQEAREKLKRDMDEYLAKGGKITRPEFGASSRDPISNQPLEITGVDPMVTKRRATASSNKIREANKAAKKAVERNAKINTHHTAIIAAVLDLEQREVTPTLNEIRKLTGQTSDSLGRRMDVLILRGYITEGVRNYHTTDAGRAYIGQVEVGNEKGEV